MARRDPIQGDTYQVDGVVVSNVGTQAWSGLIGPSKQTNFLGLPLDLFGVRPQGYTSPVENTMPLPGQGTPRTRQVATRCPKDHKGIARMWRGEINPWRTCALSG